MAGIRDSKTVDGVTYNYLTLDGKVVRQTWGSNVLDIIYDNSGLPYAFKYNGAYYIYVLNQQGDVIRIVNSTGATVAEYKYDAWGNLLVAESSLTAIGKINPIRYRGYYYDTETGFYYLQSRYYDPNIGRWINSEPNSSFGGFDICAGFVGYNAFAYCANNPVACFDPTGEFVISTVVISLVAGAVLGGTAGGIIGNMYANSNGYEGTEKIACIITGIAAGGLLCGAIGYYAAPTIASMTGVGGISVTASGFSTVAATGYSFGKLGTLIVNNGQQLIDWGKTTYHGLQRMDERGVTREMVELWARTGKALQQAGNKILYITKQGAVVINEFGKVITAYTSADFDEVMKAVVEKLFGK